MPSVCLVKPGLQTQVFVESHEALVTHSVGDEAARRRLPDAPSVVVGVVVGVVGDVVGGVGVVEGVEGVEPAVVDRVVVGVHASPTAKLVKIIHVCILNRKK